MYQEGALPIGCRGAHCPTFYSIAANEHLYREYILPLRIHIRRGPCATRRGTWIAVINRGKAGDPDVISCDRRHTVKNVGGCVKEAPLRPVPTVDLVVFSV